MSKASGIEAWLHSNWVRHEFANPALIAEGRCLRLAAQHGRYLSLVVPPNARPLSWPRLQCTSQRLGGDEQRAVDGRVRGRVERKPKPRARPYALLFTHGGLALLGRCLTLSWQLLGCSSLLRRRTLVCRARPRRRRGALQGDLRRKGWRYGRQTTNWRMNCWHRERGCGGCIENHGRIAPREYCRRTRGGC